MRLWLTAFHLLFYTGSRVRPDAYRRVLDAVGVNHTVVSGNPWDRRPVPPVGSVLVGHSFGGYTALLDAVRYPDAVDGVVLWNSHFNSRGVAPYPGMRQTDVSCPALTILSGRDERLPLSVAIHDVLEKVAYGPATSRYVLNRGMSHFGGIDHGRRASDEDVGRVASQIRGFVDAVRRGDLTDVGGMEEDLDPRLRDMIPSSIVLSDPCDVVDALLRTTVPLWVWSASKWLVFLSTRADGHVRYMFEGSGHVFIKGKPRDIGAIREKIYEWQKQAGGSDPRPVREITLPSVHPAIIPWIIRPLRAAEDRVEMIVLPVNENTTYFKIPHPGNIYTGILEKHDG
jgi:pimeloyl-ACP methyl ester carboxylesterase